MFGQNDITISCLIDFLSSEIIKGEFILNEVKAMTREKNTPRKKLHTQNKGKTAPSVTPQGYADTELAEEPKSKLENAAKKKNTK